MNQTPFVYEALSGSASAESMASTDWGSSSFSPEVAATSDDSPDTPIPSSGGLGREGEVALLAVVDALHRPACRRK